ncbi:MAG: asparagine synthase (glutamine-hydrolyzing), partial [Rhodospirillales bacterium]|nr:asparagine synthase (glutamine-hydrolyzing) [Rhodospirillales bacterium]
DQLVLGCRRLAVVDPSEDGHQPLTNETGDVWLACDGEIYNHRALRHALDLDGHHFASATDAEAVVHAYERFGLDFLDQLQGMFAIALWDDRRGRLVLARDRLGEKPLYYAERDGTLVFASEIKALLAVLPGRPRINAEALSHYLSHGRVLPPLTLFEGIRKLPPGEVLIAETGTVRRHVWWRPCRDARKAAAIRSLPAQRHIANLRAMLESSVADRLMSDVAFGACLADDPASACVTGLATRLMGRGIEAVTVLPHGAAETEAMAEAARLLGARFHPVMVAPGQAMALLGILARQFDEPMVDVAHIESWFSAKWLHDHGMVVALTGEGAGRLLPRRPPVRRSWRQRLGVLFGHHPTLAAEPPPALAPLLGEEAKAALMGPAINAVSANPQATLDRIRTELPSWLDEDPLAADLWAELRLETAEGTAMRLDTMGMAHAVEMRAPFLDAGLVEYALAIPTGQRSSLLHGVLTETLPEALLRRAPQPPFDPVARWFGPEVRMALEGRLREASLFRHGVLDGHACRRLIEEDHAGRMWVVLVLAEWYEAHGLDGIAGAGMDHRTVRTEAAE